MAAFLRLWYSRIGIYRYQTVLGAKIALSNSGSSNGIIDKLLPGVALIIFPHSRLVQPKGSPPPTNQGRGPATIGSDYIRQPHVGAFYDSSRDVSASEG